MTGKRTPPRHLPELALLAASAIWGASFLATKIGIMDSGPFGYVALRFMAATAFMVVLFPKAVRAMTRADLIAGLIVGATAFLAYAAQAVALETVPGARVAFLSALYVPLVPVLQSLLFRQRAAVAVWVGVGMGVAGVAIMSDVGASALRITTPDLLTLASAAIIALEIILIGRFVRRADPLRIAIATTGAVALFAAAFSPLLGEQMPRFTSSLIWIVAAHGAGTAFVQVAMGWGQRKVDSSRAAMIYSMAPVFGGLIGYAVGELMDASDVLGGAMIVIGVAVTTMRWHRFAAKAAERRQRRGSCLPEIRAPNDHEYRRGA